MAVNNWVRAHVEIYRSLTSTTNYFLNGVMRISSFEGRRGGLQQPGIGSATFVVDAPDGAITTTQPETVTDFRALHGRPINVRLYEQAHGDYRGYLFRGIITNHKIQRQENTYVVTLTAASRGYALNQEVTLVAGVPNESATARVDRIRKLAGADPIVTSPAMDSYQVLGYADDRKASAIQLMRECADTAAAVWWGNLFIDSAGDESPHTVWLTDDPANQRGFKFSSQPVRQSDPRLLVTSTEFTDGLGELHKVIDQEAADEYGLSPLRLSTISAAAATQELASFWRTRYRTPISAVLECWFRPNDDLADGSAWTEFVDGTSGAEAMRPGMTAELQYRVEEQAVQVGCRVEGIAWEIVPWDPEIGRPLITCRLWVLPLVFLASTRWVLGSSKLGEETAFTSDAAPGSDGFRWPAGGNVSAAAFNRFLVGQSYRFFAGDDLPAGTDKNVLVQRRSDGYFLVHVHAEGAWVPVATTEPAGAAPTPTPVPAPVTPSGLKAVAGNQLLEVSWLSVAGAASYELQYRTGSGSWTELTGITELTRTVTGLANGSAYEVQVRARNAAGVSAWSASASATPAAGGQSALAAPTGLSSSGITASAFTLSWDAVANASSYEVRVGSGSWINKGTARTHEFSGLSASTAYTAQVRAVGTGSYTTSPAASLQVTTKAAARTGVPGGVRNLQATPGDRQLVVSWDPPDTGGVATSYNLAYRPAGGTRVDIAGITATSRTITGLVNGTGYTIVVWARNATGTGLGVSIPPVEPGA